MFGKNKRPEDMTDEQMQGRLGVLTRKISRINNWVPRVAGAFGGIGIVYGALLAATVGILAAPLTVPALLVGAAAVTLAVSANVRGGYEQQVRDLAFENSNRIERGRLAMALGDAANSAIPQSTLDLRKEFSAAVRMIDSGPDLKSAIGLGNSNNMPFNYRV